ncbi:AAA family ATPase [Paeniglutamicibacter kerguelensis]|uniref:MinD-like ATPase involved in chromosome partitioning or flagellar assembly n=1 Tax=Paeniglutamicibacter kerguelensis TaxID=254788 RepID=A0ABS4XIT2_9MICC|nr:AAA family ATPase [Paeniglutamicibacter kerguelensis]MBP2388370.1 MinD-like ATPase involved in chromosome partitioning or flagellar assembly [Paeniglutamicibacter kerguelensis]
MSTTGNIIEAIVNADGTATVTIEDRTHEFEAANEEEARAKTLALVIGHAASQGAPVRALMTDEQGTWPVKVHPDGSVDADTGNVSRVVHEEPIAAPIRKRQSTPADPSPATDMEQPVTSRKPVPNADTAPQISAPEATAPQAPATGEKAANPFTQKAPTPSTNSTGQEQQPAGPGTRREARQSFLTKEQVEEPASKGWRGSLTRMGMRMAPSEDERAERGDVQAVSQHWPGPRTIAIVNGKGGAGKTPTTVLLSAIFARYGGAGVLSWDNNQTRGTLGWRTEQGPHEATLLDLLPQSEKLLGTGAQSADLAHFVHHQTRDKFDVLRSKPMALAHEQRVEPADVDAIHAVAAKYYRLIFIDSGNDESDPMWLRMIDLADQIVVATTTRNDHAEAGALLLEALAERNEHSARLAREAVAVISQADPKATRADLEHVAKGYEALVRQAVQIPHDPALVDGQISYEALRPATQRAWLASAAAVANGISNRRV